MSQNLLVAAWNTIVKKSPEGGLKMTFTSLLSYYRVLIKYHSEVTIYRHGCYRKDRGRFTIVPSLMKFTANMRGSLLLTIETLNFASPGGY